MEFCHPFDERLERLRATKLQPFICQTDATERILTMKMHEERHIDELSPSELPKLQIMLTFFFLLLVDVSFVCIQTATTR